MPHCFAYFNKISLSIVSFNCRSDDSSQNEILSGNLFSFPIDLRIEWTAARPWAYTHRVPIYGTYTHNGRSLGFPHGPNSQLLLIENRWWINPRSRISITFENLRWGKKPEDELGDGFDFGNNPNESYAIANPEYHNSTSWLIGDIQTSRTINFSFEYQLSNILGMELGYSQKKGMGEVLNNMSIQVNVDY